jgi:hypothetical protein
MNSRDITSYLTYGVYIVWWKLKLFKTNLCNSVHIYGFLKKLRPSHFMNIHNLNKITGLKIIFYVQTE